MGSKKYGEVRCRKNMFPNEARKIAERGCVGIVITQSIPSEKTKNVLHDGGIVIYEGVEAEKIEQIKESLLRDREQPNKEKE
jgi:hypothetical protein